MNRVEYLAELNKRLDALPISREDASDAGMYYEEYFAEAGPEREQDVIEELGSPAFVAAQIALKLSESPAPLTERKERKKNTKLLKIMLIGLAASPVAIPVIASAFAVIVSFAAVAFSVVFSFALTGIALFASGIVSIVYGLTTFAGSFADSTFWVGAGFFTIGFGALLTRFGFWFGGVCVKGIVKLASFFLNRGKKKSVPDNIYTKHPDDVPALKSDREN